MKVVLFLAIFFISNFGLAASTDLVKDSAEQVAIAKDFLKEENIPVKLASNEAKSSVSTSGTDKMIMSMALVLVLVGSSFIYIKKRSLKGNSLQNKAQIKILSQTYLAPKKSLVLVRVAGESILVGVGEQNINLIKSLSLLDEDIEEKITEDFKETLQNTTAESKDITTKEKVTLSNAGLNLRKQAFTAEDDFSHRGIKELISEKLKSMRSIN